MPFYPCFLIRHKPQFFDERYSQLQQNTIHTTMCNDGLLLPRTLAPIQDRFVASLALTPKPRESIWPFPLGHFPAAQRAAAASSALPSSNAA